MATKNTQQPANGTRAAGDIVLLVQQLDASGNVIGSAALADTELPAAAALGDAKATATTPTVGASLIFHNGTTNDLARGDTTNGLDVDVTRLPALVAGSAAIGKLAANSGVDIGDVDVTSLPAIPAGTNNIGDVDVLSVATGTNAIGRVGHDTTGVGSSRKVVTTAGTRVALATTTAAKWVTITAETDNTGYVVVGSAAGVIAALGTREGTPLAAGDTMTLPVDDLADVGLDSTVNGDGVSFTYGT